MNNISLTACSLWLRTKNLSSKKSIEIINLNQNIISEENQYEDFFDIIRKFCHKYNDYILSDYNQKMFKIDTKEIRVEENDNFRYTSIDVKVGGYGIDAEIIDKKLQKCHIKEQKKMLKL